MARLFSSIKWHISPGWLTRPISRPLRYTASYISLRGNQVSGIRAGSQHHDPFASTWTGVLCVLWIRGLEKDLNAIKRSDECFSLENMISLGLVIDREVATYSTPCQTSSYATSHNIVPTLFVELCSTVLWYYSFVISGTYLKVAIRPVLERCSGRRNKRTDGHRCHIWARMLRWWGLWSGFIMIRYAIWHARAKRVFKTCGLRLQRGQTIQWFQWRQSWKLFVRSPALQENPHYQFYTLDS